MRPDDAAAGPLASGTTAPPSRPDAERHAPVRTSAPTATRTATRTSAPASTPSPGDAPAPPTVDDLIAEFDEERPARRLPRGLDRLVMTWCIAVAVAVLLQVFMPLPQGSQFWLILFLGATLPVVFVTYRARLRRGVVAADRRDAPGPLDWALAAVSIVVCLYPVIPIAIGDGGGGFTAFLNRQGSLATVDVVAGAILALLILEATRRTTGVILPAVCVAFFLYAFYGGYLPLDWAVSHAGIDFDQIINGLYNDASGFFGTPLDVAASYIVLFTIYGAVLEATGAGRFFIDLSFSAFRRSRSAPGRTVVMSGFLLGTVSGSGTATAVSLGSIAWPILRRARYPREQAGGMLAAAGIGAILSPPTLGAAAFIIAEYLGVSYLDVMIWAIVPTILYYVGILLAVEIDARRFDTVAVDLPRRNPFRLLLRFGYHFLSLGVIVAFLAVGLPPFRAVIYATAVAAAMGLVERLVSRRDPLDPDAEPTSRGAAAAEYGRAVLRALGQGVRSAVPVVAVCAAAGIVVSVIVKTGIGQSLAQILVSIGEAASSDPSIVLVVTAVLAAASIIVLGLAVPVTASFIISWVVIGPALIMLGVEPAQVAMFIFYYAVLSEVSPPTALAAVAASAITGGDAIKTMWQATKYTLPAFLVPLAFVTTPQGGALLVSGAEPVEILWTTLVCLVAVAGLCAATGGWIAVRAVAVERVLCLLGAVLCLSLRPELVAAGLVVLAAALASNLVRRARTAADRPITVQKGTP
jgi:TRAP transporter 4TM/12TM fusion protein